MVIDEFAMPAAPNLLHQTLTGGGMQSVLIAGGHWCSTMRKDVNYFGTRGAGSPATEPVCGKLRALFDDVAAQPVPDQLASLADRLERALECGDLNARQKPPKI